MYKKAVRSKLRFQTTKGLLTVEQLWDLTLVDLAKAAKGLSEILKSTKGNDDLSFIDQTEEPNVVAQLQFDIVKDIYKTKQDEANSRKEEREIKAYNQKIIDLISEKKDESLKSLSVEELEKLIK